MFQAELLVFSVFLALGHLVLAIPYPVQNIRPGHGAVTSFREPLFPPYRQPPKPTTLPPSMVKLPADHGSAQKPFNNQLGRISLPIKARPSPAPQRPALPVAAAPPPAAAVAGVARPAKAAAGRPSTSSKATTVAYHGQTGTSWQYSQDTTLDTLCRNPEISTVILGYVRNFSSTHGFPVVDFGTSCLGRRGISDPVAPDLATCPALAQEVRACQRMGKKVFVSVGGPNSFLDFADEADARRAAVLLWDLFGHGDVFNVYMRPLGSVVIDGFDFAWTTSTARSTGAFVSTLRGLANMPQNSKRVLLSTTPDCERPAFHAGPHLRRAVDLELELVPVADVCAADRAQPSRLCAGAVLGCRGPVRRLVQR
ncbi:glycoside hydrolase family 18 protein [Aplosporella prunicola CBS 121167]|uniref:Glycoside hydrolase family 18 protein n=1 Tax=Aplosporella prunicola CBS 121167 TaxID=1176127 RepID=A0A6A6BBK3_9PEZI|nr:glycoside hydrolase family 18 protein [Aplosporella prunicola CBS 121167]KAF2139861.1 glycoside hydrolase family 18 protein [Aplosporella prunicola CBS 121167]